jgi:hypothetical protein
VTKKPLCGDECYDICDEYPPSCVRVKGHKGGHVYKLRVKILGQTTTIRLTWERIKKPIKFANKYTGQVSLSDSNTLIPVEIVDAVRQAVVPNLATRRLIQP